MPVRVRALQLGQLLLGIGQALLQHLLLLAEAVLGLTLQRFDHHERRVKRPRERTLISASVPERLSSALITKAPLSAQGWGTR